MNITAFPRIDGRRFAQASVLSVCLALSSSFSLHAGVDANGTATPDKEIQDKATVAGASSEEETPEGKNWVEVGVGGLITKGDAAQFKQEHRISGDVFGGIQDMHYEQAVGKAQLSVDGHAIFDNDDYDVKVELSQPGLGYIRGGYTEFRSWYDGNGGFFPVNGQFFTPPHQEMTLDRGEAWIELGLRMPKLPEITVHYSHQFRDGEKDSTIWGDTTVTGLVVNPTRKIAPAFRDINETRDIFSLDILQNFGKTDVGLGMRYEHSDVDDRLQLERGAGQATQRFITQKDQNGLDAFNGHFTTETRFSDSLWFTAAYSYSTLDSDLTGTRIPGSHYDSMFGEAPQFTDSGFINLAGISEVDEHVVNLNVLWMPVKNLTFLTAFRYTHEDKDSASTYLATTTQTIAAATMRSADTSEESNNFAETMELRYDGINNWLFYARGDWEEETGKVHEHEVVGPNDQGALNKDTDLLSQKYTAGANWYPMAILNLSGQYYHKMADYNNDFKSELFPPPPNNLGRERNQRLISQELDTDDVNVRLTWRPKIPANLGTLALVTRYDFMRGTVDGRWAISPTSTPAVGTLNNTFLASQQSAVLTNHVITESLTWNPCARLYLQGSFSYVLNKTDTPADYNLSPNTSVTVLDFTNDYWTVTGGAGYALDQKTDLSAEYTFYRADNYVNNALVAVPYGMAATEHTVSASVSRQIAKNIRLRLQYSYFNYTDELSGGHDNYEAHSLFSSLQFRF